MQLRTDLFFPTQGNRVGDDHLRQTGLRDTVQRRAGQYRVRAGSPHFPCTLIGASLRTLHNSPRRIDHVVQEQYALALHVSDNVHDLRLIGALATLIDNRKIRLQPLG